MKISGFTFVRNGFKLGYPVLESLQSLLDICDEVVIAIGNSDDETEERIKNLGNPKIIIISTVWDETLREGGTILAQQTDIALQHCTGDWLLYLQADEVLHEKDYDIIKQYAHRYFHHPTIEGLLFSYYHFFGNYNYIGTGRQWYRSEIRMIKNTNSVFSWRDAQGFRTKDANGIRKLKVASIPASVYHYGWVRNPIAYLKKQAAFHKLYHDDTWLKEHLPKSEEFPSCYQLDTFTATHPTIMNNKIQSDLQWCDQFNPTIRKKRPFIVLLLDTIEKITGYRIGEYKNYTLID
jgi:glycosyltransferase involved in cell wall biosynthesis